MRVVLICVPVSEFKFLSVVSATQWSVLSKALSGPSHGVGQQQADLLLSSLTLNLKGRTSLLHLSILQSPAQDFLFP